MRRFTPKEDRFILANYKKMPMKVISRKLGRTDSVARQRLVLLGHTVPKDIVEKFRKESQFKPGQRPQNKGKKMSRAVYNKVKHTFFQPGHIPHNAKERDGVIVVRRDHKDRFNSKPYKWFRVGLGRWMLYHRYRWEMFRGKIPKGHCLWFKDGDTMNVKLSNLECITRAENARRNRSGFLTLPPEIRQTKTLINKIQTKIHHAKQNY